MLTAVPDPIDDAKDTTGASVSLLDSERSCLLVLIGVRTDTHAEGIDPHKPVVGVA